MPDYKAINRIRRSPDAFKALAGHILTAKHWRGRAKQFLADVAHYRHSELTMRQCELLIKLRDSAESVTRIRGFSVSILIESAYLARLDLDDDEDIKRVESLYRRGKGTISGLQAGWFRRICRELDLIEHYI